MWQATFGIATIAVIVESVFLMAEGVDPISGGAGWIGAGLLGCVLAWLLLKHLPAKDKQMDDKDELIRKIVAAKDAQIDAKDTLIKSIISEHTRVEADQRKFHGEMEEKQRIEFRETLALQRIEFKDTLSAMLEHEKDQVTGLGLALKDDLQSLQKVIDALASRLKSGNHI